MSLNISLPYSLFLVIFLVMIPLSSCFNITSILEDGSDFTTFNAYLTQTQLANKINSRSTITVLAVGNSAMPAISGKPNDVLKKILSLHVILDYYDEKKLKHLPKNKPTILTTLFQSTGNATDQLGFLNVTSTFSNGIRFGSASGTGQAVKLLASFASQPYNISVLQVSGVIIPSSIDNTPNNSSSSTNSPPSPSPSDYNSSAPSSDDSTPTSDDTPSEAPTNAPTPSPAPGPAPRASADAPSDSVDDGGDKKSSAHGVVASGYAPIVMTTILFFAMFF